MALEYGEAGPQLRGRPDISELTGTITPVSPLDVLAVELTAVDDVPVTSNRSTLAVAGEIDWLLIEPPFKGSRSWANQTERPPKPMSDLERRRLNRHHREMAGIELYVRNHLFGIGAGGRMGDQLNPEQTVNLIITLKYLPHYLTFRAHNSMPYDGLPVSLAQLHNSATGALAGIFATIKAGVKHPTTEKIIEEVERAHRLLGEETVCVAGPRIMRYFYDVAMQGLSRRAVVPTWLPEVLTAEEMPVLASFAKTMQRCEDELRIFAGFDLETSQPVLEELRRRSSKHNPRRLHALLRDYDDACSRTLRSIHAKQTTVNTCLGRLRGLPEVRAGQLGFLLVPILAAELRRRKPAYVPGGLASF